MNGENHGSGELTRPLSTTATFRDMIPGSTPWKEPLTQNAAANRLSLSSKLSSMGLLRALKRRLAISLGLAILLCSLSTVAAWNLLPLPKFKAEAKLLVKSQTPQIAYKTAEAQNDGDYPSYQKTQLTLLKSRFVINAALQEKGISKLQTIKEHKDPVNWLQDNLQAQFLQGSQILEISLAGEKADELAIVVNAVTRAYLEGVANEDLKQRNERHDMLKKLSLEYAETTKRGRQELRKLAQTAGSEDRETMILKQQYALEYNANARRELQQIQSEKRKIESMLKIRGPNALQETAAPLISTEKVERLIDQHPEVDAIRARLADEQNRYDSEAVHTSRVARKSMDPSVKMLKEEVELLKKQLSKKRAEVRSAVIKQLRNPDRDSPTPEGGSLAEQLAVAQVMEQSLKDEIERLSKADRTLTEDTLDLQELKDELKQTQESADMISREAEVLNVELKAPPRIKKIEDAVEPTTRDSKKWWMMLSMIAIGSFFVPLLGVAFLELQSAKVDSADEVVIDLGMSVVGSLPMLPSKARRNGVVAHQEKDRYWQNLLLESIDATRTMLVHAARSGSHRVVMITSALSGEGKTSLASHLATSLARSRQRTLLIDADLRNPSIHRLFDLPPDPGLSELLRGETGLEAVIASTAIEELKVMTAGKCDYLTLSILAEGGMGGIFSALRDQFDFVIVDTSPVLPVADASIIAQQVDAVLFSVLTNVSRKTKIFAAHQRLATLGVKILGAVVTGSHDGVYGTNYYPGEAYSIPSQTASTSTETEAAS